MRHGKAPVAHHGLSYFAFALGFIFPCAQRCFSSRNSFLRAAALMRPRLRGLRAALGGRPTLRRPVELTASSAEIARSMRTDVEEEFIFMKEDLRRIKAVLPEKLGVAID